MKSDHSSCLRGRHYSGTINQNVYEKVNPKTQKIGKVIRVKCSICGRI